MEDSSGQSLLFQFILLSSFLFNFGNFFYNFIFCTKKNARIRRRSAVVIRADIVYTMR